MDQVNTDYDDINGITENSLNETETTRIPADAIPYHKLSRKIATNLHNATEHIEFLNECIIKNTVPKGLQGKITPQIPENNWEFLLKGEETLKECGKKLRLQLKDFYQTRQETLKQDYPKSKNRTRNKMQQRRIQFSA